MAQQNSQVGLAGKTQGQAVDNEPEICQEIKRLHYSVEALHEGQVHLLSRLSPILLPSPTKELNCKNSPRGTPLGSELAVIVDRLREIADIQQGIIDSLAL